MRVVCRHVLPLLLLGSICPLAAQSDTLVSGPISTSTTWTLAGSPYIVTADVAVRNAVAPVPVLTIQAGVTVKFNAGRSLLIGELYPGEIQAIGTAAQPITFTANTATPAPGFWQSIRFSSAATAASRISYATVRYGGVVGNWGPLSIEGSSPTLQNITAQNNAHSGISVFGGSPTISGSSLSSNPLGLWVRDATVSLSSTTISNNSTGGISVLQFVATPPSLSLSTVSITNNAGYAMSLDPRMTLGTTSNLTITGNTSNAVELRGGVVDLNTTWKQLPVPYVITNDVVVQKPAATPILTIAAGTTVKFNAGRSLKIAESHPGRLAAVGTSASRIVFTANSASPSPGFWRGIQVHPLAAAASRIAYADVSYGGLPGNWGGVHAEVAMSLDHVRFTSNAYAGISVNAASPIVISCDFASNTAGLINQTPPTVADARLNWWGAGTGPSGGGPGTGQSVSAGTKYEPWLTAAATAPQSLTSFTLKNTVFNPSIGINANFTFASALSGNWTLTVANGGGSTVRTVTGTGTTGSPSWDGKNSSGVDQPNGTYTYQVNSTAGANSAAPAKGFSVIDRTRQLSAEGLGVAPAFFSPNADAVQDTTTLTGTSSFDGATWTVNVKNSGGTVVRTTTGPADPAISYTWDGRNASNAIQPDGIYTLELVLTDGPASSTYTPTSTLDRTLPTAAITSPAAGATLSNVYQSGSANVNVVGTSNDSNLLNWTLDYGPGWIGIATGTSAVVAGNLGIFATLPLTNANYDLRLRVWDKAGNLSTLTRNHSIGNFKVAPNVRAFNGGAGGTVQYTSTVPFALTETLVIKNSSGQVIRTLFSGSRGAGSFVDTWNGRNDAAVLQPDAPYFYVATATAGSNSMTWDLTNQYLNDYDTSSTGSVYAGTTQFEPFNNIPLTLNYTFNLAGAMEPGRVWLYFSPDSSYLQTLNALPDPGTCNQAPNFCVPAGEYQASGSYSRTWSGLDPAGVLRKDIQAIVFMVRRDSFSKNALVLYGTRPALTNLRVAPAFHNPSAGPQTISFNLTSFQNQAVSATLSIMNLETRSVLRTLARTGQAPGLVTFSWDGRADNGMWVAPGRYAVTAAVSDGLGNQDNSQILTMVRY